MEDIGEGEGGSRIWIALVTAGVVAAGAGIYFGRSLLAPKAVPVAIPQAEPKPESPFSTMTLEQGDVVFRDKARTLSAEGLWGRWLKTEDLLRRLAAATALVAEGKSPRASLEFLGPGATFKVVKKKDGLYIDPKSYARYDAVADVVRGVDADGTAKLMQEIMILFQKAYGELGGPRSNFQDVWLQAVNNLLATPIVEGDIRVRKKVVAYVMTDDTLERLSPAQKHLLRMGPQNEVKIQGKLRQIALALGVPESQLSTPKPYSSAP